LSNSPDLILGSLEKEAFENLTKNDKDILGEI